MSDWATQVCNVQDELNYMADMEALIKENNALRQRVQELEADKARLDWLEENACDCKYMPVSRYWWLDDDSGSKAPTIRQAIDAARQKEGEK